MSFPVTLYVRKDCPLCQKAEEDLRALQVEIPHNLVVVDVDNDLDLQAAYGERVPVVKSGAFTFASPFGLKELRWKLMAARDWHIQQAEDFGEQYLKKVNRRQVLTVGERLSYWLAKHYLFMLNLLIFTYVGLPFMAPVFMHAGLPALAKPIYAAYSITCHQLSFRSWFMYGEQPAYPRQAAGVKDWLTYGQATGLNEGDLVQARKYIGDEIVGYKVAYCQRDVAIYLAMLLFGLLYALFGRRIPPLPWYLWVLIGMVPIGLDGLSQLVSQLPGWILWAYRESTPLMRTLTGGLFGFTTAWFGFPLFEETMQETRLYLASKIARLAAENNQTSAASQR
jgi:uncharacterized membrane protein